MVCSNQPTDGGRSPQAGRATLASHQARSGLGHAEGIPNALSHDEALDAIIGCAATVTVLSYQEAIEGYLKLRGIAL